METLLRIALSNAALASVAAILAWTVGRLARRPALTHALWLIVLLKLVTPPLWTVPMHVPTDRQSKSADRAPLRMPSVPQAASDQRELYVSVTDSLPSTDPEPTSNGETPAASAADEVTPAMERPAVVAAAVPSPVAGYAGWNWKRAVPAATAVVWASGALLLLSVSLRRIIAFGRVLHYAITAEPRYQRRVDQLARRLGMGAGPRVQIVPGAVCPMLWSATARPRILVPAGLWDRLGERQRDTLLLHELAHLRRRDHWVRWIELLATALYWWNPVCWWARDQLREAEEQCCDAWVLWAMPDSFRHYASALLEAVDFVSVRRSVPLLASGMGQFGHLKRRLTMLKQGNVARALTWGGLAATCGVGAMLLSITPIFAQTAAPKDAEQNRQSTPEVAPAAEAPAAPAAEQRPDAPANVRTAPAAVPAPALTPQAPNSGYGLPVAPPAGATGPGDAAPASPAPLPALTARSEDNIFREELRDEEAGSNNKPQTTGKNQAELEKARREVADLSRRLQQAAQRLQQLEMASAQTAVAQAQADLMRANAGTDMRRDVRIEMRDGRIVSVAPVAPGMPPTIATTPKGPAISYRRLPDARLAGPADRDRRLDAVEQQLSQLLDEVKKLRAERDSKPQSPGERQTR